MEQRHYILVCLVFAALLAATWLLGVRTIAPPPYRETLFSNDAYDPRPMREAVDASALRSRMEDVLAHGSRFLGQRGFYAVADGIRRAYHDAGLEVYELGNDTVAPRTVRREILSADGEPLPDVEVYPFMPNQLQPMVTPKEGLTGRLVLMTDKVFRSRRRFDDSIALVDCRPGHVSKALGLNWANYARLGAKAVIVSHPDGLDAIEWHRVAAPTGTMVADVPVNYVRLAATRNIFRYVGKRITLRIRTKYAVVPNNTIIGVLRAPRPASEALVLAASYDACSVLPDRAPGVIQAIPLAFQRCFLEGLLRYRASLERDVIFLSTGAQVMAQEGMNNIVALLGYNRGRLPSKTAGPDPRRAPVEERIRRNEAAMRRVEAILKCFETPAFLVSPEATGALMRGLDEGTREFLEAQAHYVLYSLVSELAEDALRAKIAFEESGGHLESPTFKTYLAARRSSEEAVASAGFSLVNLVRSKPEFLERYDVRRRFLRRMRELQAHHLRRREVLDQSLAVVDLFSRYRKLLVANTKLLPAYSDLQRQEVLTILKCEKARNSPSAKALLDVIASARRRLGLTERVKTPELETLVMGRADPYMPNADHFWGFLGYPAFTFTNEGRVDAKWRYTSPADLPFMRNVDSIRDSAAVCAESLLLVAHGNGVFPDPKEMVWFGRNFSGRVLVSNVGPTAVPDYPLKHALVCPPSPGAANQWSAVGFYNLLIIGTDVYGRYDRPNTTSDFVGWANFWATRGYSPLAAGYDERGLINCIKDEGPSGQRLYKSVGLSGSGQSAFTDVTIVTFRSSPVTLLDLTNPQTMKDYTGVELISTEGLAAFDKECTLAGPGIMTKFVEPDARFFVTFQAGTPENELAKETRAFMLGTDDSFQPDGERDIDGPGFLACKTPIMRRVPFEVAHSVIDVNGKRLALQNRYHMTDETTRRYHAKSEQLYKESLNPSLPFHSAELKAGSAVAYGMLTHPVLRGSISEAVAGILWYLGLMVPFIIFFEKLVFGFPDVRKQLAAQAVIFLVIFGLLDLLHPAFRMVRASAMILLGFVILLISTGITLLFAGKFRENLEELNALRGKVAGAEVDTIGVAVSAFVLGLNNMRRRKVRTGLTCTTLVLMTVAMICFTSIQSDEVNVSTAVGKAPYQGILYKDERLKPVTGLDALRARYGDRFDLAERRMLLGQRAGENPRLEMAYERGGLTRRVEVHSVLQFSACEPLRSKIRFVTRTKWFTKDDENGSGALCPVMIPDVLAEQLGIFAADVDRGGVLVRLNGREFEVRGIFESASLDALQDLDGRGLLPFDLELMERPDVSGGVPVADDAAPRIEGARLVIMPNREMGFRAEGAAPTPRLVSVAVLMPNLSYREARTAIETYLEQTGRPAYYGLGGIAYLGERGRRRSLVGLIDMLIPLIIAAMTVLNTMKGSVYERRHEILVYNAVGIAPRYIFFMFFSEAFVYVVIGAVLGYLVSQSAGRVLTALHLTGGLKMTFTSLNTIYASLAIAFSVLASTWFPARSAKAIAAPAEDAGWRLPEPEGDRLAFDLPFTFTWQDRVAILAFFERYLDDHGEGGAGRFFAGDIRVGTRQEPERSAPDGCLPQITATIWLKPFDLAVSQRMAIMLPTDEETGEFKAIVTLTRLSGTRESWLRLNRGFVSQIRRHFLHWRAVSPQRRREMFEEARALLERSRMEARV